METMDLVGLREDVGRRVAVALDEHTAEFAEAGPPLTELLAPARALTGGGKRLRAQLCGAGWVAAGGGPDLGAVVLAGSALELFQAAALVHDDVMDDSDTRRGMPSAHRRFAATHAERTWLGDAGVYGRSGAIVLGDLLLATSSMEMERARAGVPDGPGARARRIYDLMTAEVAFGQYLDVRSQELPWGTPAAALERARQVLRHKSARYSVEHPLVLGAALAGADDTLLDRLRAVGLPLGEAFQLRDDVLGVFGDPEVTGKPAGDDLREGKRTALLAMTLERADGADAGYVRARVGADDLTPEDVDRIRQIMRRTGAVRAHENLIEECYARGLRALRAAEVPEPAQELLTGLAGALTSRTA